LSGYLGLDWTEQTKMLSQQQMAGMMLASAGYVTSLDLAKKMGKVMLQPIGIETGWIPLAYMFGLVSLPPEGTEVLVVFEMGNLNMGRIICSFQVPEDPRPIARVGDEITVTVPGHGTLTGTITSGSDMVHCG